MTKKWILRILCGVLVTAMLISIIPLGCFALENDTSNQFELDRAAALGLPTEKLGQKTVTGLEMTRLLDHLVNLIDSGKLTHWKTIAPNFRTGTAPITRYDAMVAVLLAAEVLGEEQMNNDHWGELHSTIGEKCWDGIQWNDHLFADVDTERMVGDFYILPAAYFYSFGRTSLLSGNYLFDYDKVSNSMRTDEKLTYEEALRAITRMHDSIERNLSTERLETEIDQQILSDAKNRKSQILNAQSDWTLGKGGKIYYVSPNGDDRNDGLSPATAWKSLGKVNSAVLEDHNADYFLNSDGFPEYKWAAANRNQWADLNPGDVVLFERGGLWRGVLRTKSGVTYSAYGEGPKPEIWGSPENGSGAEKWSLLQGTKNIWVFYRPLQDCGGILLDEGTVAIKKMAFWDSERRTYLDVGNNQHFSIEELENAPVLDPKTMDNLWFFNDITYSDNDPGYGSVGTLYLRCDAGNPGEIYDSIEFFTGNNTWNQNLAHTADGVTLDNLSLRYGTAGVQMQGNANATVRNCCIYWVGGFTLGYEINVDGETFNRTGATVSRSGDGIMSGGTNNTVKDNYIYQTFDWAITAEEYAGNFINGQSEVPRDNIDISGNLIERCAGGIGIFDWYAWEYCVNAPTFTNLTIADNQILYSAMTGWAHLEDYDAGETYLAALAFALNPGVSGIKIRNNTFYQTSEISQMITAWTFDDRETAISFDGNTYVQQNFVPMVYFQKRIALGNTAYECEFRNIMTHAGTAGEIEEVLHDRNSEVALPSIAIKQTMDHSFISATCTAPKTCKICGETEGTTLSHKWNAATCTKPKTCKTCGKTSGKAFSHDLGEWTTTTKPTTSKNGKEIRECQRNGCDYSESRSLGKKPAAPILTLSSDSASGKPVLKWDVSTIAKKYQIQRKIGQDGTYQTLATVSGTVYTDQSAEAGKAYYYRIRAVSETGVTSDYCISKSRTCDLPQPKVSASNVPSTGKIKLTWEKVSGAVKYEVYRATSKNGTCSKLGSTTKASYTNISTEVGKTYYYQVKAIHSNTNANSAYSPVVSRTCDLPQPEVTISNVASTGKIKLTWKEIDGAKEYKLYRATTRDGEYKLINTTTNLSLTNTSTTAGNPYYYKVKAIAEKSAADSAYSEIKSRTCDLPRPNVTISQNSAGKPKVSWDAVDGAVSYKVYRATAKNGEYTLMKTTTSLSYTNTSAASGTTYYYHVVAVCSKTAGNSAPSNTVSIKVK